ncbi:hypothetical protein [Prevotella sp. HUN102]|uniref:hypothetical protein n=1 Tax=Prevotella sp. HUN102 TaxID=1392486 RepID=UPI000A796D53|nr:hypothetical protein [Prevotella sp. HUN102]
MKKKKYSNPEINIISVESSTQVLTGSPPRGNTETWEEGEDLQAEEGAFFEEGSMV